MGTYFKSIDRFAAALTRRVIANRGKVLLGAVLIAVMIGSGAGKLGFSTNYRVFFSGGESDWNATPPAIQHSLAIFFSSAYIHDRSFINRQNYGSKHDITVRWPASRV